MSEDGEDFDATAAAAKATGRPNDDVPIETVDDVDQDDQDDEDVVDLGGAVAAIVATLVAADERGPTARTFQERLDLDEGTAHMLDGVVDIVLDLVDVDVGDTIGPAGKLAVGVSRFGGDGDDQTSRDQRQQTRDVGDDGLSQEAREVVAGVDSAS